MSALIKHEDQQKRIATYKDLATIAIKSGCYGAMTVDTAMNVMLSASDLGVSPMKALNGGFHVIKGKISMAGHLISDRIRAAGHSIKVIEHTRDKCVMIGVRKDNGDSYKCEYDIEDAKLAGLQKSQTWMSYPKDMLYNRAISRLGRILFSDVVGACYSEDEGHDIAQTPTELRPLHDPDSIEITPSPKAVCVPLLNDDAFDTLKERLDIDSVDTSHLKDFILGLSERYKQPADHVVDRALKEFERFKTTYEKHVAKLCPPEQVS